MLCAWGAPAASAQNDNTPPASRGENFSNKPAPALFKDDCTGSGCHKGPQGLARGQSQGSLAGFLREHYTNSRESAAALSAYLLKLPPAPAPAQPSPRAASTREAAPPARSGPSWFEPEPSGPSRQQQQQQQQRPARAAARSGEDAAPTPPAAVPSAPAAAEPPARPAREPRNQRGRQQPTAAATAPVPAPEAAPPPPPPAPPPPQWDIFD